MKSDRVVIVGAGVAGLAAAIDMSAQGMDVTVLERSPAPGGKVREERVGDMRIDVGPTVFTMRWVFDELFAASGTSLESHLTLERADVLARHVWDGNGYLDLFSDVDRSADAIGDFCGAEEAARYRRFCEQSMCAYRTLLDPFIRSPRPSVSSLVRSVGLARLGELWRIKPFATLWSELTSQFHDPRLRQLFARYATYCGSSPYDAPATLMLIAHVEREGVWLVDGGMFRLAQALEKVAQTNGAEIRYDCEVSEVVVQNGRTRGVKLGSGQMVFADYVVMNADLRALGEGLFGGDAARAVQMPPSNTRSLSAVTWAIVGHARGLALTRHNIFFGPNYRAEFADLFTNARLPENPTVYVCAQDRGGPSQHVGAERLFCLVNAPPIGDHHRFEQGEINRCQDQVFRQLESAGLKIERTAQNCRVTTPNDFERRFPASGGALYGRTTHGWSASFARPHARSRIPGLYLAGGGTHPGPGVPMAALSGRMAAASLLADRISQRRFHPVVTAGGTRTR